MMLGKKNSGNPLFVYEMGSESEPKHTARLLIRLRPAAGAAAAALVGVLAHLHRRLRACSGPRQHIVIFYLLNIHSHHLRPLLEGAQHAHHLVHLPLQPIQLLGLGGGGKSF